MLFAKLANADDWQEVGIFAQSNEEFLRQYIELENGIPSHDTMQRVMGSIAPEYMQGIYKKWNELISSNKGEALKKIICIGGKTMRGNSQKNRRQIISVLPAVTWMGSVWGRKVEEKSNEIMDILALYPLRTNRN